MIHPVMAAVLLQRLASIASPTVALTPEDHEGSGLPIIKRLVADGQPIFVYVDRLLLMSHIQRTYNLHPRGTSVHRIRQGL